MAVAKKSAQIRCRKAERNPSSAALRNESPCKTFQVCVEEATPRTPDSMLWLAPVIERTREELALAVLPALAAIVLVVKILILFSASDPAAAVIFFTDLPRELLIEVSR